MQRKAKAFEYLKKVFSPMGRSGALMEVEVPRASGQLTKYRKQRKKANKQARLSRKVNRKGGK